MSQLEGDVKSIKKVIYWLIGLIILISTISFIVKKTREVTKIDSAVINYEEFQEIYNTCYKINTDICNMEDIPSDDPMFSQFSKQQRILALKTQLNRWVEEYNAKSKMWGRALWKSNELPHQLNNKQFICNN